jgi:hypothetical protein
MTHLVQTPGITVEQHLHTVPNDLFRLFLRQERTRQVDARLLLDSLAQEGLGNVRTKPCGEGRGGVCRAEQVDVAEEAIMSAD